MNRVSVNVLLSTYNGQEYLKEQIDSVLAQEDVDVFLYIRDDGSSDDTIKLIREYKDKRIKLYIGNNIGPAKSFLRLLKKCDKADYYAYCDQDDYWYPRKLISAVEMLRNVNGPALFASTYDVADEKMNVLFTYDLHLEEPFSLQNALIYRTPSGCNMVFNHELRNVINTSPGFVRMHDYWTLITALLCKAEVIIVNKPFMKYRQHQKQVSGITPTALRKIKSLSQSAFKGKNERWRQAVTALKVYGKHADHSNRELLNRVVGYRYGLKNRFLLIKDKKYNTGSKKINLLFKISVLLGLF